jgi:hypothetical protein
MANIYTDKERDIYHQNILWAQQSYRQMRLAALGSHARNVWRERWRTHLTIAYGILGKPIPS